MSENKELTAQGWREKGVFEEPRLSEIITIYKELGFEVRCEPFEAADGGDCTECMRVLADRCQRVYTRKTIRPI